MTLEEKNKLRELCDRQPKSGGDPLLFRYLKNADMASAFPGLLDDYEELEKSREWWKVKAEKYAARLEEAGLTKTVEPQEETKEQREPFRYSGARVY